MAVAAALPYIAAAATAAGAGVDYYNASETNKKQQDAEAQVYNDQQAKQKQASGIVQNQVNTIAKSTPQAESNAATQGFINTLRQNAATTNATTPAIGGAANKKYSTDVAANTSAANDYSTGLASDIAGVVAPQRQRMDEGQAFQNTATQVGGVQQQAQQQSFVDQLRAKSITQNPWLGLAGKVLGGVGTAASLGGTSPLTAAGNLALTTGTQAAVGANGTQMADPNYYRRYAVNLPTGQ